MFLLSGLAEHTRNILADARASLLVADGEGGLLQQARVTLIGLVTPVVLDEAALGRYLRYSPESADYLALGADAIVARLVAEAARPADTGGSA